MKRSVALTLAVALSVGIAGQAVQAQNPQGPAPEYPPFQDVIRGFEQVSTAGGGPTMYTLYLRKKDNRLLAELPPDYMMRKYFVALTVASGETYAGLQAGDMYVYWKPYDKRLALVEPALGVRSSGDAESQSSVKRLFTDRVILDVPILTLHPNGGPVIDLGGLLVGQAGKFFGPRAQPSNPMLINVKTAKAFPHNVELAFEAPMYDGRLKTLHYSISLIPENTGYRLREADLRVGYFTTSYNDLGKYKETDTWVRYVNRWHLEKRDPSLKLSPPKNPIVFYIESSTPVRYRPWVKQGILYWNQGFERVGIRDAIEVRQQDALTGEHMEKDPEDVRYNFVRWLNNNIGTAIGPSRVHPVTGQILDADIILTDGWIRHYVQQHRDVLPSTAMEGFGPETLAWLDSHPRWDPRVLLAPPSERPRLLEERARRGPQPYGGHPMGNADPTFLGDDEFDGLRGRVSQCNGYCAAAHGKAMDVAMFRMTYEILGGQQALGPRDGDLLDGMPEEFVGPLVAHLVAHEVGHTLGLRHNFKASSVYSLADINNEKMKGKPLAGSVMDYLPINMDMKDGAIQGDFAMIGIGPYDLWAIEYGYTFENDLKPILARVAEPELQYATDEDTIGPDPLARRYDLSTNPIDFARSRMRLAKMHRERMIDKFVKEGESWARARQGYELTLRMQTQAVSNMADWLGGAFVHRDHKGDKNGRAPLEIVPVEKQREALKFVIENSFYDEAFGLTPDLLKHLTLDQWLDNGGFFFFEDPAWPVHDEIMGIQGSTLTMLMNPTTLRLVFDNEVRTPPDVDVLTLPELLSTISAAVWSELDKKPEQAATARKPMVSSLRRNLQREHLERLIDLTMPDAGFSAAHKPISNLALLRLRDIKARIARSMEQEQLLDPYTLAHLTEAQVRIDKALDAQYIYNTNDLRGGGGSIQIILGNENGRPSNERRAEPQSE